ncbi:hypothetical protein H5410_029505 [Solanum commersonii]|uniref:Uncharacterized protein n=1 Tax=Solanum commersonii TaxID=4109 RepID=A0A9J5Z6Z7_SOLCO|nr:hypothetical protein H5410_029505 [Solanum commersonii]
MTSLVNSITKYALVVSPIATAIEDKLPLRKIGSLMSGSKRAQQFIRTSRSFARLQKQGDSIMYDPSELSTIRVSRLQRFENDGGRAFAFV